MIENRSDPGADPGSNEPAKVAPEDLRAVTLLRRAGAVETPPPPHIWESVRTAVTATAGDRPGLRLVRGEGRTRSHGHRQGGAGGWAGGVAKLLVAAAVGGLVTWGGLEMSGVRDSGDDGGVLLASGELSALTVDGTDGSASVVEVDGQKRLRVRLSSSLNPEDGYLEVWLLRPDVSGLVTLGVLEGETADFPLPEGLDLTEYAVVDISREHMDGDPGHGGASLVRGQVG